MLIKSCEMDPNTHETNPNKINPNENEESDTDNEEFYFESDHLALRGNTDYTSVLRTLIVLEAQRIQAIKDLEKLNELRKQALEDPINFVQSLTKNEIEFPKSIQIAEIPSIDFEKYNVNFPNINNPRSKAENNTIDTSELIFKEDKCDTFNQHWSTEEQRRLEELLVEYPPEQFEMRRFAKISRALGNRTTKQVASRVQKFFKKLHAAGLPIPGRIPKARNMAKVSKFSKITFRPSTFFPSYNVPVCMPEDDDMTETDLKFNTMSTNTSVKSFDKDCTPNQISNFNEFDVDNFESDDEKTFENNQHNDQMKILKLLQRVKNDKEKDITERSESIHYNYKCNYCSEEPIMGTRWHCHTCTQQSVDFCSDCLISQVMSPNPHSINHKFRGIRVSNEQQYGEGEGDDHSEFGDGNLQDGTFDKDYLLSKFSKDQKYNYLDPNFIS